MKKSIISASSLQTKNIAQALAWTILETKPQKGAWVLALTGELGSGKTTFTQGFAKGLGIKEKILSPTFILLKEFTLSFDRAPRFKCLYHIDCYRLDSPEKDLLHLGWEKIVQDPGNIVVVEWADRVKNIIPKDALWLSFFHAKGGGTASRIIKFNAT